MQFETLQIGATIRRRRNEMKISLDTAAALTGVSKAMLGQIERGESNPTVAILWKISNGLKVPFSSFLSEPDNDQALIHLDDLIPVEEEGGGMLVYSIFPFNPISGLDYLNIVMKPFCSHDSMPHANVATEYIVVIKGTLRMTIDGKDYILKENNAISFRGFLSHTYANPTDKETIFQNVIKYI
ncbi:helix-turn-helix domain-containing protein [Eubacterium aggregans]|uniref:helix-turn-helix domain-containing protein n=1 Tax=Eubacterium aggregans TaxID=81409 RepID=UPI003F330DC3